MFPYDNFPLCSIRASGHRQRWRPGGEKRAGFSGIQISMHGTTIREDADVDRVAEALLRKVELASMRGVMGCSSVSFTDQVSLIMPVTPGTYQWSVGKRMETININEMGDVYRPGGRNRFTETLPSCSPPSITFGWRQAPEQSPSTTWIT